MAVKVFVIQHVVTLTEATKIMRPFKLKKHAKHGYFFELEDMGMSMLKASAIPRLRVYKDGVLNLNPTAAWWKENAYILRVYREVPDR